VKLLPESLLADTAFGSDENVCLAEAMGTELVSPVAGPKGDDQVEEPTTAESIPPLLIDDFSIDERTGTVKACPSGKIPLKVLCDAKTGTTTIEMNPEDCKACPFFDACPMQRKGTKYETSYTDKQRRLEERRREQQTEPFQERDAKRSGKAVAHALYVRVAGWNMLQAVRSVGLMAKVRAILAGRGLLGRFSARQLAWGRNHPARRATRPTKTAAIILRRAW